MTNRSGHKFPTSYPSRRAYIHFVVRSESGDIIFESGKTNTNGSIAGVDADSNLNAYEQHYEEITQSNQVQVYETIMGNTDNEVTYTLLRAATYLKDNRIPPAGFDKFSVEDDIRVAGLAMTDNDFNSGSDTVTYKIPVNGNSFTITAELKYQSLAYGFMQDLFLDADNPEVARFKSMYDSASLRSETVALVNTTVQR